MKILRSTVALLMTAVFLLAAIPAISVFAEDIILDATKVNTTRGEGDLVVYTPSFGKTTNTNEWGAEAVIDATGKCTYVGTAGNNTIPDGGFVISGHDGNKTAVLTNIKVGMYAAFNEKAMKIIISDKPIHNASEYEVSAKIDGTNKPRLENLLILYTNSGKTTNTNVWGCEVVVTDGVVTQIGGNNSLIPAGSNSFVLSGHGEKSEWLTKNVMLGMTVTIEGDTVTFKYTASTSASSLKMKIEALTTKLDDAEKRFAMIDSDKARKEIAAIKKDYDTVLAAYEKNKDGEALVSACSELERRVEKLSVGLCESMPVEYRGVWLRPTQTTEKAVDEYVERLYNAGINVICIETLYDSCMIMPMPEGSLFVQNPKWKGFDMLKAYIDSCHKRGMELHIWMPIFYVGHTNGNYALSVGKKKPSWLSVNNVGKPTSPDSDFLMIDPSNKEACDYLLSTYRYILENYDIDGFEMDYIRYVANGEYDWGYNEGLVNAFKEKYGVTPKYDTKASYWNNWCDFRASYVTEMVYNIRKLVDEVKPGVILSADVAAEEGHSKRGVYQYYHEWLSKGILDVVHAMAYGNSYYTRITEVNKMCGDTCYNAVGLGTFDSAITTEALVGHTQHIVNVGGNGAIFFEASTYLGRNLYSNLENLYSERALSPMNENAIKTFVDHEFERIDLMVSKKALSSDKAAELKAAFEEYSKGGVEPTNVKNAIKSVSDVNAKNALNTAYTSLTRLMYMHDLIARDFGSHEVVDIPVIPSDDPSDDPVSDATPSEDSKDSSEASEAQDTSSASEDETESKGGINPVVIVVLVAAAAIAVIILLAAIVIKKK